MKDMINFIYENCIDGFNSVEPSIKERLESEKNDEMFNEYIAKSYKNKLF